MEYHRTFLSLIIAAVLLPSCAARDSTAVLHSTAENVAAVPRLQQDLQSLFDSPPTAHAQWAVMFHSLARGETLFTLNAGKLMVPASSQKLLTSAVAAERLGWDYRYTTRVLSTAPIGSDGSIDGDLVIVGSGDPTINPRHPDRWRAFDDWAQTLKTKGVTTVSGRLIGDDNTFAEPGWGFGWSWDDLHLGYGAEPSALQYHENQVEVFVGPGMAAASRAVIGTSPLGSGLVIDQGVTTVAPGEPTTISLGRMPGSPVLAVRGQIAADAKPVTVYASVENPTRFFVTALREAFVRHGIFVNGGVADIDDLRAPLDHAQLHELIVDQSPPLSDIIDVALKWSRNIYAESMLLSLAPAVTPATGARGIDLLRETMEQWGISSRSFVARDGSGLSRYDYVTADEMTQLLIQMWMDPRHHEAFQATLPVSGSSGTLATRMKGTAAEGRVRAKTGTMSNVRSLCGYVTTLEGETVVFAILANDFQISAAEIDGLMDRALQRVVQFTRSGRD